MGRGQRPPLSMAWYSCAGEACGAAFYVTGEQNRKRPPILCPYCGLALAAQELKMFAVRRYRRLHG